jgi:hypothetical protein
MHKYVDTFAQGICLSELPKNRTVMKKQNTAIPTTFVRLVLLYGTAELKIESAAGRPPWDSTQMRCWPNCWDTQPPDCNSSSSKGSSPSIYPVLSMQRVTKRCRLSLLTNSAPHIRVQMRGEGKTCGVSANKYSCAHHVTWSPN